MIKANELRIGNWVILSEDSTKFIIEEISKTGLVVQNSQETAWIEIEEFEPIPLTEEILLKCGFEHSIAGLFGNNYMLNSVSIQLKTLGAYILVCYPKCEIKYLHQLQNLYFALTGQELEINL